MVSWSILYAVVIKPSYPYKLPSKHRLPKPVCPSPRASAVTLVPFLHRLGHPLLHLFYAGFILQTSQVSFSVAFFLSLHIQQDEGRSNPYRWVGAQHLRDLLPAMLVQVLHAPPVPDGLARIIARLGHHHQANVVGLGLHLARHGQAEEVVLDEHSPRETPQDEEGEARQGAGEEEEAA